MTRARLAAVFLCAVLAAVTFASSARAEQAAAVTPGNVLVLFDTSSPNTVTSRAITGLGANETVRGIDVRPATGQVYIVTVTTGFRGELADQDLHARYKHRGGDVRRRYDGACRRGRRPDRLGLQPHVGPDPIRQHE